MYSPGSTDGPVEEGRRPAARFRRETGPPAVVLSLEFAQFTFRTSDHLWRAAHAEVLSPHRSLPGIDAAGRNRGRPAYERVYSRDRYRHYRRRAAGRHGHGQQRRDGTHACDRHQFRWDLCRGSVARGPVQSRCRAERVQDGLPHQRPVARGRRLLDRLSARDGSHQRDRHRGGVVHAGASARRAMYRGLSLASRCASCR